MGQGASHAEQIVFLEDKLSKKEGIVEELMKKIDSLEQQLAAYRAALTPSSETKAAYIGEVEFKQDYFDEDGEEQTEVILVPWTSMKEFMAIIRGYAKAKMEK